MPRLPVGKALAPIPFPRPAPARYDAPEWNRADLGDDAAAATATLDLGWKALEERQAEDRFNQWQLAEKQRYDEAVRGLKVPNSATAEFGGPGKVRGFADGYAAGFFERAKVFRESVPKSLRPTYDEKLFGFEKSLHEDAFAFEAAEQKRASRLSIDDAVKAIVPSAESAARLAGADLERTRGLAEVEGRALARIDGDPTLGPEEKHNEKRRVREAIQTSFAEALAPADKQKLDPSKIHETAGERIRAVESGGDPERRNPDSAALGPDQFLEGPWLGLTRKYRPDLYEDRSEADVLALRTDPELSAEMRDRYAEENAEVLEGRGHDTTPGSIYLAHLLGPLGAAAMLEADPATPADRVNPEAAAKNKAIFYAEGDTSRPLTAGDFVAWANTRMEGTALADWGRRLDALRPELKLAIARDAGIRAAREAADAALAEREAYDDRVTETETAIASGDFGLTDLDKAHDGGKGWLKDEADRARLKSAIERHAGEVAGYEAAVTKFLTPGYAFDADSAEDQAAVDLLYRLGPSQGGAGLADGDQRAITYLQRLVTRTGIVPTGAEAFVEGVGTRVEDAEGAPENVAGALTDSIRDVGQGVRELPKQVVGGLRDAAQAGLDLVDLMGDYVALGASKIGLEDPNRAAELMAERNVPELPEVAGAKSVTGNFVRKATQFLVGYAIAGKQLGALADGTRVLRPILQGGLTVFEFFDESEANLFNLLRDVGLDREFTRFMATKPDDDKALGRLKNAFADAILGVVAEPVQQALTKAFGAAVISLRAAKAAQGGQPPAASAPAPNVVDPMRPPFGAAGTPPVKFTGKEFADDADALSVNELAKLALDFAKKHLAKKKVRNEEKGWEILIPPGNIKKTLHKLVSRKTVLATAKLDDLIKYAKLVASVDDRRGRPDVFKIHLFDVVAEIAGKPTPMRIFVREQRDGSRYYEHAELK